MAKVTAMVDDAQFRDNETLFSHLLDETIAFETDLRGPSSLLSPHRCAPFAEFGFVSSRVLALFTQSPLLELWLQLEHRNCSAQLEQLLMNTQCWQPRFSQLEHIDQALPSLIP
jgi:hypothetical protein